MKIVRFFRKNFKTNGKIVYVHESEEFIMVKCPYNPKPSTDLTQSPSKYQRHSTQKQNNPKFVEPKTTQITKAILKKRVDFKLYYKAILVKAVWYWHKNTYKDQ